MTKMLIDRAVVEQALEALRHVVRQAQENLVPTIHYGPVHDVMNSLEAALAEPVQEPFCYAYEYDSPYGLHREFYPREYNGMKPSRTVPLYTAPPQRKPLTEEEISNIWDGHIVHVFGKNGINPVVFTRAVERAHGIGVQP